MPAACPYCSAAIDPPPKQARKCRSCGETFYVRKGQVLTAAGARSYDEQFGNDWKWLTPEEQFERRREWTKQAVTMHRQMGRLLRGFRIRGTNDICHCEFCRKMEGKLVSAKSFTMAMLPPFRQCTTEEGCRCRIVPELTEPGK